MKRLLYLTLFCLLPLLSLSAKAETVAATNQAVTPIAGFAVGGFWGASGMAACQAFWDTGARYGATSLAAANMTTMKCEAWYGSSYSTNWATITYAWRCTQSGTIYGSVPNCDTQLACPANGNWTLTGSNCTRPDCLSTETRDSNGVCVSSCANKAGQSVGGAITGTGVISGAACLVGACASYQGCAIGNCAQGTQSGTGAETKWAFIGCSYTGSSQDSNPTNPVNLNTDAPMTPDRCLAKGQAYITTSSGTTCISTTNPANATPTKTVAKSSSTINGETTTNTTETTCTGGACNSTTTTSGAGGTTTSGTSGSGQSFCALNPTNPACTGANNPSNDDLCAKNPNLQICKGGMNEEATQKKVLAELEKMGNPGNTPYDAVTNAKETDTAKQANDTENTKFSDAAKGVFDPVASQKSSWETAMSSGWFSPIPASGCTPFSGTVGGRSFTIDHCPTASKVSVILEYAMWFMVVVGVFVMFTGGRAQGA